MVFCDFDRDADVDIYVANDLVRNFLYRNNGDGTFQDVAYAAGVGFDINGKPQAGMGVDCGDVDGNGFPELFVTNFSEELNTLYENRGDGLFEDVSQKAGLGSGFLPLGFGTKMFDVDNDGDLDIHVTNGHVIDNIKLYQSKLTYEQADLLYENVGGRFKDVSAESGPALRAPRVGRGLAVADFDNDGKLDVAITSLGRKAVLLRNVAPGAGNWLEIRAEGAKSNRFGLGTTVRVQTPGRLQVREINNAASYLSSNDTRLHVGLGDAAAAQQLDILWPSGQRQTLTGVKANQILTVKEPENSGHSKGLWRATSVASTMTSWRFCCGLAPALPPEPEPGGLDARGEAQAGARSAGAAQAGLHGIAAILLRAIERHVRAIDECRDAQRVAGDRGRDADARGDANRPANRAHLERLDRVAHRFGDPQGVLDRRIGEDHQELVAAETAAHVALPQHAVQHGADRRQHGVAGHVAVAIVDRLEAVEVDHQHRHLQSGARGAPQAGLQQFHRVRARVTAGEAIARAGLPQVLDRDQVLRRHRQHLRRALRVPGRLGRLRRGAHAEHAHRLAFGRERRPGGTGGYARGRLRGRRRLPTCRVPRAGPRCRGSAAAGAKGRRQHRAGLRAWSPTRAR